MATSRPSSTIHYEEAGEGRPLIVLPGLPIDHTCEMPSFEPVFAGRSGWRRIYPDLPGMGRTPPNDSIRSLDDMAGTVGDFIDRITEGAPFALAGQSFGGYIARGVTPPRAERMLGLMLWVSALYPRDRRRRPRPTVLHEDSAVMAGLTSDAQEYAEAMVVQNSEGVAAIRELLLPASKRSNQPFLNGIVAHPFRAEPETVPFSKPSLILCGRQDFWVGYEDQFALMNAYPRATFAALDYAGHLLGTSEQNGLFRALVSDWLDRMERAAR